MRAAALAALVLAVALPARADTQTCIAAHVAVQEKRLAGDLSGAQTSAAVCAAPDCPAALRGECTRWTDDITRELPTVEVAVTGASPGVATKLTVDGEPRDLEGPVALNPGHHSIELTAGTKQIRRSVHLVQGQREKLTIDLSAPPPPPPEADKEAAIPVGPIVLGAVGVASLGLFAVMGGLGAAEYGELEASCAPRCSEAETSAVDTKLLVADVALGVGSAAVLAGSIWLIVDLVGRDGPPVSVTGRGLSIAF